MNKWLGQVKIMYYWINMRNKVRLNFFKRFSITIGSLWINFESQKRWISQGLGKHTSYVTPTSPLYFRPELTMSKIDTRYCLWFHRTFLQQLTLATKWRKCLASGKWSTAEFNTLDKWNWNYMFDLKLNDERIKI